MGDKDFQTLGLADRKLPPRRNSAGWILIFVAGIILLVIVLQLNVWFIPGIIFVALWYWWKDPQMIIPLWGTERDAERDAVRCPKCKVELHGVDGYIYVPELDLIQCGTCGHQFDANLLVQPTEEENM